MPEVREMADVKNLALPAVIAIAVPGAAFALMGVMPLMVFTLAFGGGFVLYVATLWRTPIDTTKILVPGFSLHDELETMVDIGMSPCEALRTSTYNAALLSEQVG